MDKKRFITSFILLFSATTMLLAQEASKKYGLKSGTITTVSEVMGQKIESKGYFDDYGNLQVSKANTFGMEISTILRDGKTYMVNHSAKQVQQMPVQETINYLDLSDEIISKYKIQEAGKETVSGKECVKYTLEVSQMGQTAQLTVCVWQGFPMKTVTRANGMEVVATITEITECEVDPSLFEVPTF